MLVGAEKLRRSLPASAIEAIEDEQGRPMSDLEMAGLVRSVHGVAALQYFKAVLEERGLNPPQVWAGGSKAKRFVTDLGFSPELAGFSVDARPATFAVDGPAELSPLHDYQEFVTGRIKADAARGRARPRDGVAPDRCRQDARRRAGAGRGDPRRTASRARSCGSRRVTSSASRPSRRWTYIWRAIGPVAR